MQCINNILYSCVLIVKVFKRRLKKVPSDLIQVKSYVNISIVIPVLGLSDSITPGCRPVRIKFPPPKKAIPDYADRVRTKPVKLDRASLTISNKFEIHPLTIEAPNNISANSGLSTLCWLLSMFPLVKVMWYEAGMRRNTYSDSEERLWIQGWVSLGPIVPAELAWDDGTCDHIHVKFSTTLHSPLVSVRENFWHCKSNTAVCCIIVGNVKANCTTPYGC